MASDFRNFHTSSHLKIIRYMVSNLYVGSKPNVTWHEKMGLMCP